MKRLDAIRRQAKVQKALRFFDYYFNNYPAHGAKLLARRYQSWLEFTFWFMLPVPITLYFLFLLNILNDLYEQKMGLDIDANYVKFVSTKPTFTFCSDTNLDEVKVEAFLREHTTTDLERSYMHVFLKELFNITMGSNQLITPRSIKFEPKQYMSLLSNLLEHTLVQSEDGSLGVPILSGLGLCYTFNTILADAASLFRTSDTIEVFPQQLGAEMTYDFYSYFPLSFRYKYNFTKSVKVYIHAPWEVPLPWDRPTATIEHGKNLKLTIETTDITYAGDFMRASIMVRQCRTPTESNLEIYPQQYTHNFCLLNCRALVAVRQCRCIPHFYATRALHARYPQMEVCGINGLNCFANLSKFDLSTCNCLPNCAAVEVDTSLQTFDEFAMKSTKSNVKWNFEAMLESPPMTQFRQRVYYTYVDYFLSVGSLLTMIYGGSLLGVVWTGYCWTLRLFWFLRGYPGRLN